MENGGRERTSEGGGYEDGCKSTNSAHEGSISYVPSFCAQVGVRRIAAAVDDYAEDYKNLELVSFPRFGNCKHDSRSVNENSSYMTTDFWKQVIMSI